MATRKTASTKKARAKTLGPNETPLARALTFIFTLLCFIFLGLAYANYVMPGL